MSVYPNFECLLISVKIKRSVSCVKSNDKSTEKNYHVYLHLSYVVIVISTISKPINYPVFCDLILIRKFFVFYFSLQSELCTFGSRRGMECMPLRTTSGPYHYHVNDQTKSLQVNNIFFYFIVKRKT